MASVSQVGAQSSCSLLSHLERLGLKINLAKSSLSPSQQVAFLGTVIDLAQIRLAHAGTLTDNSVASG